MREKEKFIYARLRRRLLQHVQFTRLLILSFTLLSALVFAVFIVPQAIIFGQKVHQSYSYLTTFLKGPQALKNTRGLTNILILGVGGQGHEGPDLTDSIILFSYNHKSGGITTLSIPRDLWMPDIRAKINTAFHYGEEKKPGGGFLLAKSEVEVVTGQKVDYAVMIDFGIFKEIIDTLGGIEVCLDRPFDDYLYPIPGMEDAPTESSRYEHLHLDAGCRTISGDVTLKFVRSRYAEGSEGTDFARSKRQQKVILAVKDKLIARGLAFDVGTFIKINNSVLKNITTDIPSDLFPALIRIALGARSQNITSGEIALDDSIASRPGLLVNPPVGPAQDYQWVLIPKSGQGNWNSIRDYVSNLFSGNLNN